MKTDLKKTFVLAALGVALSGLGARAQTPSLEKTALQVDKALQNAFSDLQRQIKEKTHVKAASEEPQSPKGDGRVSSLQVLVDELTPKLGPVKDAETFTRAYGPKLESALGWGAYVDSPTRGDRFSVTVRFPVCASEEAVKAANGDLSAPAPKGTVRLKVWSLPSLGRCDGHDR